MVLGPPSIRPSEEDLGASVVPKHPNSQVDPADKKDSLLQIPGIGKKIRDRLIEYYYTEEAALSALRTGTVGCVPGISHKSAIKYAQQLFELDHHLTIADVLKTPEVLEIYEQIVSHIAPYLHSEYARHKVRLFYPLPSPLRPIIATRQTYFRRAIQSVSQYGAELEAQNLSDLLGRVDTFKQPHEIPRIKGRILLTDSVAVQTFCDTQNLASLIYTETVELPKKRMQNVTVSENLEPLYPDHFSPPNSEVRSPIEPYCQQFDVVLYCGANAAQLPVLPNLIPVAEKILTLEAIVPETIINVFALNRVLIQTLIKIILTVKNLKDPALLGEFTDRWDLKKLKAIKENTALLTSDGDIAAGIDPTLDRFRSIFHTFETLVTETEGKINAAIQQEIGDRSVQIQGKQILDLYRTDLSPEMLRNYVPPEVEDIMIEIIHKHIRTLGQQLQLDKLNQDLITALIPEQLEYPVQLPPDAIQRLQKTISTRLHVHRFAVMTKIAQQLRENYLYLLQLHQSVLEFDFFYGIGRFAVEFGLTIPTIESQHRGFVGVAMRNLDLVASAGDSTGTPIADIVPITYQIGTIGCTILTETASPESDLGLSSVLGAPASIALLTGSNSGGKTICLLTCIQALLLAQMGFPTLGEVRFSPVEEFYYFKKSAGQLSAGAFETTLLQFVSLARSTATKYVFADELESITDPQAAAKVLAGIMTVFLENSHNLGVFVTHLVELIRQELPVDALSRIRIDGIEASGLNDALELQVMRSPRFHFLARSTPEFILQRLAQSGSTEQRAFFTYLLQKFAPVPAHTSPNSF